MLRKRIRGNRLKVLTFLCLTLWDVLLILFFYHFLLGYAPSDGNIWYLTPLLFLSNAYYSFTYGGGIFVTLIVMLMNHWSVFLVVMKKPATIIMLLLAMGAKFLFFHCCYGKKIHYVGSCAGQERLTYNCQEGFNYPALSLEKIENAKNKEIIFEKSSDFWKANSSEAQNFKSVVCMDGNPIDNRFKENAATNHLANIIPDKKPNKLIIFFTNQKLVARNYIDRFSKKQGANLFLVTNNPELMFLRPETQNMTGWNFKSFLLTSNALNKDVNTLLVQIDETILFGQNKSLVFIDCYEVNQFNFPDYLMIIRRLRTSILVSRWLNINYQGISSTDSILNVLKKINFLDDPALFNLTIPAEIYKPGMASKFPNCYLNKKIAFIDFDTFVAIVNYCASVSTHELMENRHFVLQLKQRIPTQELLYGISSYGGISMENFYPTGDMDFYHFAKLDNNSLLATDPMAPITGLNAYSFIQEQLGKSSTVIFKNLQQIFSQIYLPRED
jgi:hypothetical protein